MDQQGLTSHPLKTVLIAHETVARSPQIMSIVIIYRMGPV